MKESEYEFYWCIIKDSIEYYCHFDILIREFLKVYNKMNMIKTLEENYTNNEIECRIEYLTDFVHRNLNKDKYKDIRLEIVTCISEYQKYKKLEVLTFKIKFECKIVILSEMLKQGFV